MRGGAASRYRANPVRHLVCDVGRRPGKSLRQGRIGAGTQCRVQDRPPLAKDIHMLDCPAILDRTKLETAAWVDGLSRREASPQADIPIRGRREGRGFRRPCHRVCPIPGRLLIEVNASLPAPRLVRTSFQRAGWDLQRAPPQVFDAHQDRPSHNPRTVLGRALIIVAAGDERHPVVFLMPQNG